jgi:chromosome segregation ATPase
MANPTIYLGKFASINSNAFDLGTSTVTTSQTPTANFHIANKMYVDDTVSVQKGRIDAILDTLGIDTQQITTVTNLMAALDAAPDDSISALLLEQVNSLATTKSDLTQEIADREAAFVEVYDEIGNESVARIAAEGVIAARVTSLEGNKTTTDNSIDAISDRVDTLEENKTTTDASIEAISDRVDTLEANKTTTDGSITAISDRVDTLEENKTTTDASINALDIKVNTHISRYGENKTTTDNNINSLTDKINYIYRTFFHMNASQATGVDSDDQIIFQSAQ